jgi:hypothetical protein
MPIMTPMQMSGSNLEQRLAKLERVVKVGNDGSVTIELADAGSRMRPERAGCWLL